MQIVKIILENFQSHKHTEIDLAEAITLITGSSDAGKSSLVRAIRWVLFNRAPKGSFMRDRKKVTRVTLVYDSGDILIRERGPKFNQYKLNKDVYQALRSDVPAEIKNFHNLTLDNCQWQHPHYFLIDDTAGQVAKRLNEVADLEIMGESLRVVNSFVKEADGKVTQLQENIKEGNEKVEARAWIDPAKKLADTGLVHMTAHQQIKQTQENLQTIVDQAVNATEELKTFPDLTGIVTVEDTLKKYDEFETLKDLHGELSNDLTNVNLLVTTLQEFINTDSTEIDSAIDLTKEFYTLLNKSNEIAAVTIDIDKLNQKLKEFPVRDFEINLENFENRRLTIISNRSELRRAIAELTKQQNQLKDSELKVLDAEEAYEKYTKELGVCPLCNNKFKGDPCRESVATPNRV